MRFGTQFLVTMMLIKYLITSIIFLRIFYSSFPKKKIQIKKKDYLDVKSYKGIHKPQKGISVYSRI